MNNDAEGILHIVHCPVVRSEQNLAGRADTQRRDVPLQLQNISLDN